MDEQKTKKELIAELAVLRQRVMDLEEKAIASDKQSQVTPAEKSRELNSPVVDHPGPPRNHTGLNQKNGVKQKAGEQTTPLTARPDPNAQTEYHHAEVQQQSRRLNQILAVSELLHRGLELEQVLAQIVEGVLKLGFQTAVLNVYEPAKERVTVRAMAGLSEADRATLAGATYRWSDFQALMQERFRVSRSYLVRHDEFDWEREFEGITIIPEIEYRGPGYWHPENTLIVPLWTTQGGPLGMLSVDNPVDGRFPDPDTIRTLESFANQAAIALENARLHRQARQDAETRAVLLREVNHRVQNNLAAIVGLISIEQSRAASANQETCRAILQDLFNRIQGLATVHRMLSDTEWSPLPLSELTHRIITSTFKTLPLDKHIAVDVSPSPIQVGSRHANSLALVINELATNAIKYALAGRLAGHITVRIEDEGDWIQVEFRDDGPGFPEEILRQGHHTVGLHLIRTIVHRDLDGELTLHNHNGAVTRIRFKPQPQTGNSKYGRKDPKGFHD